MLTMPTFSLLLAFFVVSLVLSIPLAYLLVALFKYSIEKKINSYNDFNDPIPDAQLEKNHQSLPCFVRVEKIPIAITGVSLLRELPMVAALIISGLLANYLSFRATINFSTGVYLFYLMLVLFPIIYYFYFLFEHQLRKRKQLLTIAVMVLLICAVYVFVQSGGVLAGMGGLLYLYGGSSLLFMLGIFFGRIREIIYAMLPPLYFAVAGFSLLANNLSANDAALHTIVNSVFDVLRLVGLAQHSHTVIMVLFYSLFTAVFVALLFLARYGFIKKIINNTIFLFDVLWFFHLSFVISLGERSHFLLWILATFFLYKITFYALAFLLKNNWKIEHKKSLLVLRVFSLNKESAFLFRRLRSFWRYQGPIHLIAGYDLTATTIDVDDLLMFISGRMKTRFNLSSSLITKNFEKHDELPDVNGHYRVNEMYCNNVTWKTVIDKLVKKVDFVIMDIRSFSRKNNGCAHEIKELIYKMPISAICFVIDKRTDINFLQEFAADAWKELPVGSPNLNVPENSFFMMYDYSSENGLGKFLS